MLRIDAKYTTPTKIDHPTVNALSNVSWYLYSLHSPLIREWTLLHNLTV